MILVAMATHITEEENATFSEIIPERTEHFETLGEFMTTEENCANLTENFENAMDILKDDTDTIVNAVCSDMEENEIVTLEYYDDITDEDDIDYPGGRKKSYYLVCRFV